MKEVVLDTETTGLSVKEGHRIVEIGCIELDNLVPTKNKFHCYLNPKRKVSEKAFEIHGYSDDFLSKQIEFNEIVDELRIIFPSTKIFTIPTGWATKNLAQMQVDDLLLDEIELFGPKPTSIFTDPKRHQGQIIIEAGTLIWLNSIYSEELSSNNYETGFNTNLHSIAVDIMNGHDLNYKR